MLRHFLYIASWIVWGTVVLQVSASPQDLEAPQVEATELDTLVSLASFPQPDASPFRLVGTLKVRNGETRLNGTFEWTWQSPRRFKKVISLADYREVRVVKDAQMTWFRNVGYTPRVIREVKSTLDVAFGLPSDAESSWAPARQKRVEGRELLCRRSKGSSKTSSLRQVCFAAPTGRLHSLEDHSGAVFTLDDWTTFERVALPMSLHKTVSREVEVDITFAPPESLETIDDSTWNLTMPGTKTWEWCPPESYQGPQPRKRLPDLGVGVNLELDREGQFTAVFIVGFGSTYGSAKLHKRVRAIRFDPATCDGVPVESEFFISGSRGRS